MYAALYAADLAFAKQGLECVITAALDGDHNPGSLHAQGYAIDIRNGQCNSPQHLAIYEALQRLERYGFDVVDEKPGQTGKTTDRHFHIEFQPKPGEVFFRCLP